MEYKVAFVDGYFDVKLIGKSSIEDAAAYFDAIALLSGAGFSTGCESRTTGPGIAG